MHYMRAKLINKKQNYNHKHTKLRNEKQTKKKQKKTENTQIRLVKMKFLRTVNLIG